VLHFNSKRKHINVTIGTEEFLTNIIFLIDICLFNPLKAELNPICHLLASLGAHHILYVSRIRVNICFNLNISISIGFGGLDVACWPLEPAFAG